MNKVRLLACSSLLALSSCALADGFYFQAGGGAGFVDGAINKGGTYASISDPFLLTPIVDTTGSTTGAWFVGLGYMFSKYFGLEANYIGYSNTTANKNQTEGGIERKYQMSTDIYQIDLLGVARTPFEVGFGFFVKAKGGVGYTDQRQNVTATDTSMLYTFQSHNQNEKKFMPVLGIGIERDMTDLVSVSLEYLAAINNEVENSMVYLSIKFNPFDVMSSMGY